MSKYLIAILKFGFAGALIAWMLHSGKLDLHQIATATRRPGHILLIVLFCYLNNILLAFRWLLLLRAQNFKISFGHAISLTMIGVFFSSLIPGAVSGDLLKAFYAAQRSPDRKAEATSTILLDRVIGLLGLLLLASVSALNILPLILSKHVLLAVFSMVAICTLGAVFIFFAMVALSDQIVGLLDKVAVRFQLAAVLSRCVATLPIYRKRPRSLVAAFGVTVVCQCLTCAAFLIAGSAIGMAPVHPVVYFSLVPLGLVTLAVPVAPAGIGVGQMAFFALFDLVASRGSFGSAIFTLFNFVYIAVSLTGIVFYLLEGSRSRKAAVLAESA